MIIYRCIILLFLFCGFWHSPIKSQQLTYTNTVPLKGIEQLSVDRYQHVYAITPTGMVYQLDSIGKELAIYSPQQNNQIDLTSSWQAVQLFFFYEELQTFRLCDRFLGNCLPYSFENTPLGYVNIAALAADGNLWLFDQEDFAIKKYNYRTQQIIHANPLSQIIEEPAFEISYMREYQNRLFILSETTLYQFDLFGNLEHQWDDLGAINWVGFWRNQLYYINQKQELIFRSLYNKKLVSYKLEKQYQQLVQVNDHTLVGLHKGGLDWYTLIQVKN